MLVVDFPHLAPSLCIVCERATLNVKYVDTLKDFQPVAPTHLDGRKYLCEECVRDASHGLGLFEAERAEFIDRFNELSAALVLAEEKAAAIEAWHKSVEKLMPFIPGGGQPAEKPKRAPRAPKAEA